MASKDTFIAVLREQLRDKDDKGETLRQHIQALETQLRAMEQQHGPLLPFVEAVEEKMASAVQQKIRSMLAPTMQGMLMEPKAGAQVAVTRRMNSPSPVSTQRTPVSAQPCVGGGLPQVPVGVGVRPVAVNGAQPMTSPCMTRGWSAGDLSRPPLAKTVGWSLQGAPPVGQPVILAREKPTS